ncbi:MAG TPA: tetratricopeptide repeat protein [Pirellulales bacterium]|nr:tetratricopeptide repeat protein [Pirellulales bacterium]
MSGAILALVAHAALSGPAEDQYAVAAGHYKEKRWKFAADEFQAFLVQNPEHASASKARFYLGESLLQLRRFDDAAQAFRAFAEHAPQDRLATKARFRAGEAVYLAGRYAESQAELERFYTDFPDDPLNGYVLAYLGDIAARNNDFRLSQKWYEEALRRFPQGPLADDCRFGLAKALETQGGVEDARRLYLALASKSRNAWADKSQFRLAASFYAGGDYEQALACFQDLLEVPRFAGSGLRVKAALAAGQSLYQLNRLEPAGKRFESLLAEKSVAAEARYWLGLVQAARHEWLKAADTLLLAAEESGEGKLAASALFQAGDALLHAGKAKAAEDQFQRVLRVWPDGEFAQKSAVGLVQAALLSGDHESVDRLAERFAEEYPESSMRDQVDRLVGRSLLEQKNFEGASSVFERLTATETADASPQKDADRCLLAAAYTGLGRYDDALQAVDPVSIGKDPSDSGDAADAAKRQLWIDVHRQRAAALIGLNRFADALPLLERLSSAGRDAAKSDPSAAIWTPAEMAVCLAKTGQLDRAKSLYADQLSQSQDTDVLPSAILSLAESALDQLDATWASELFGRLAAGKSPFKARALWGLARSELKLGETSQAVEALDRLLTDHADDPLASQAALARGQLLEQLKDDEAALRSYRQVIDKYPTSSALAPALLAAARAEHRLKQPQKAAALYEQLDRQFPAAPEHDAVLYEWAWTLRDLDEPDKASEIFERLHTLMPKSRFWADAVYRLAERTYETKDYPRAAQLTSELIGGDPGEEVLPHALYLEAQIAAAQNEWPRTTAPLERLLAEFPESPIVPLARYLLAEAAYREADFDRAAEAFRELAESTQGRSDKWLGMIPLRRAQILARNKEWHDALEMASQIETDFPDFEQQYEVDYVIGRCHASLGNFDDARAAYRRVVKSEAGEKSETAAKAQWMIGETFFHQKNYESALREYLRVEILYAYPTWQAAALFEAAKCHENLGEPKQAAELYDKLMKSYPDSPLVKDAAQRLNALEGHTQK